MRRPQRRERPLPVASSSIVACRGGDVYSTRLASAGVRNRLSKLTDAWQSKEEPGQCPADVNMLQGAGDGVDTLGAACRVGWFVSNPAKAARRMELGGNDFHAVDSASDEPRPDLTTHAA